MLLGAVACLGLLAVSPAGGASPAPTVGSLRADDAALAAKSRAAVLDLYSLDERLATAQQRLSTLDRAGRQLVAERGSLRHELRLARLDVHLSQVRLATRLRFIYDHGATTTLDVFMGAKSLQDAMTQVDDFNRVAAANADVVIQVHSAQAQMIHLRHRLGIRERTLSATKAAAGRTVAELEQLHAGRVAYLGQLVSERSEDAARISELNAQADAAVVRSETLVTPRVQQDLVEQPVAPVAAAISSSAPRTLTVSATAYDLPGRTSTGLPVGWGIAAVDPSVIPLGTHIVVPGYGVAVAADTGSAVVGATIDLWFPTAAQADAWGRRTVTIDVQ
ncbi:MAG TPA: 3D domain-containing protein [Gaiellaceae bacterium]|jgi:3D (Asp-Asp-Asp) domain-containing protein|nr:3D domain-containing protein [Gaiellaceae bacterium]